MGIGDKGPAGPAPIGTGPRADKRTAAPIRGHGRERHQMDIRTLGRGVLAAALVAAVAAPLSACNTVEGIGKDVKAGGKVIEDSAQKTKDAITD